MRHACRESAAPAPEGASVKRPPGETAGMHGIRERFARAAKATSRATGSAWAFAVAVLAVAAWAATGPLFGYSDSWQLFINTGTTVATFLMVFVIQQSQNRDTKAVHLKLDALIAGLQGPSDRLIDAEDLPEAELDALEAAFRDLAAQVRGGDAGLAQEAVDALRALRDRREAGGARP